MTGRGDIRDVHRRLLRHYGTQHWWPAGSPFEVMVGAVLTQNTAWTNVERAIANLRTAGVLEARAIVDCPPGRLANLLRPSGYFNVKAARLRALCQWYLGRGGLERLKFRSTNALRTDLLSVKGVGPETADDILLYAFGRPVFVIDAYTRRLFSRLGVLDGNAPYEVLRSQFQQALGTHVKVYNEYHALIVLHAKEVCRSRPRCGVCILQSRCPRKGQGG